MKNKAIFNLSAYFFGALFVGAVVIYQYGLYIINLFDYPLGYQGDGLFTMAIAKMYQENGIIFGTNTYKLNYPYSSNLEEWYPIPEKILYFTFALLAKLYGIYSAANLIQIITHIFSTLGFIAAAKLLGINNKYSFLGGVIYGLTPFIFSRGLAHLTVGAVWLVPIMTVILLLIMENLENKKELSNKFKAVTIIVAIACTGLSPYYSFMFGQFLGIILIISMIKKQYNEAKNIIIILLVMLLTFIILNLTFLRNSIIFESGNIRNLAALEVYALKLPELIFPAGYNRIGSFSQFSINNYYNPAFIKGELWSPYLGIVGIIAAIYFIASFFYQHFISKVKYLTPFLLQTGWILIFSLVGGFNLIAGVFGFQYIRATNRYSIWLLAIFLLYGFYKISRNNFLNKKTPFLIICFVTLILLWIDLPIAYNLKSRNEIAQKIENDRTLINYLEFKYDNPKVYTLPSMYFPENGPINKIIDYDFLRFYLNSTHTKINYGGIKGDKTVPSFKKINDVNSEEINMLKLAGFTSIVINKNGYKEDNLKKIIDDIEKNKIKKDFENTDYIVYNITSTEIKEKSINKPILMYSKGWSTDEGNWRWAIKNKTIIKIYCNKECKEKYGRARLSFDIQSYGEKRNISIQINNNIVWKNEIDSKVFKVKIPINIEDIDNIYISSTGKLIQASKDDIRKLSFRILNVTYEEN